jgi:uncharacterized BrkB/YihY/UPF0761 family membrane protein
LDGDGATGRGVETLLVIRARDRAVAGNLLASAIAYRLFFWMLPLALFVTAGLGFVEASSSGQSQRVAGNMGFGKSVAAVVANASDQAERSRWLLLVFALVGLYTAGSAGARTLIAVHRFAWAMGPGVSAKGPMPPAVFTGLSFAMIGLAAGAQYLRQVSPGFGLVVTVSVVVGYTALWLAISIALPHGDAPWKRLVPGALFLGAGAELLHLVSVYYLSGKIESSSELYGGLGVAAALLLGLYLVARLIVAAALLNATLWQRAESRSSSTPRDWVSADGQPAELVTPRRSLDRGEERGAPPDTP